MTLPLLITLIVPVSIVFGVLTGLVVYHVLKRQ